MKAEAEGLRARRAGVRLIAFGFVLEVVGLLLLAFVDQRSGGAVTHANVARTGYGIPLIVGFPGTLGYVLSVLGIYRLVSGRSPGEEPRSLPAVLARVVFIVLSVGVFFAASFWIVTKLRG